MDPVCHTLVGAALGRAGLARRTALGMTALVVGANLPDIDVLAYLGGPAADLSFRRGWTHGLLALAVLPALFTGALLAVHHLWRRASHASLPSGARPLELLVLSYLAALTHPLLDILNTYGIRWLMPFSEQWYYGDTLFIVDPWVWLALGAGVYLGRKRRLKTGFLVNPTRPPRMALLGVAFYMAVMALSGRLAERMIVEEAARAGGPPVEMAMVAPLPVTPFGRKVVAIRGDHYVTGTFRWIGRPHLIPASVHEFSRGYPTDPGIPEALQTPVAQRFLGWARFPTFRVRTAGDGGRVIDIIDLRYANAPAGFGTLTVPLTVSASPPFGDTPPPSASIDRAVPVP